MSTTLDKIAAGDVSRMLAEQGIAKDQLVTVLVDEDMAEVARRIRAKAKAKACSVTDEVLETLTKDL